MIPFIPLIAPLAALSPAGVGVGECDILDIVPDIVAEQASPFQPPERVEDPSLTFYIECGVMEYRPTTSGGMFVAASLQFAVVVEDDNFRVVQVAFEGVPNDDGVITTR